MINSVVGFLPRALPHKWRQRLQSSAFDHLRAPLGFFGSVLILCVEPPVKARSVSWLQRSQAPSSVEETQRCGSSYRICVEAVVRVTAYRRLQDAVGGGVESVCG